ncbi:MAG TPA: hypothetical protein PKU97_16435 [Kofleriaceae bacterium]|nr:hypothetical protein [Kofleriaceae bacterium]
MAMALSLGACSGGAGPQGALEGYSAALRRRDYTSAYDMMSSTFRARVSRDEFVSMMRDNPREVGETSDRLRGRGDVEVSAELRYGLGDSIRLVQEGGQWKLASNPLAFYDQSSPRAALRSFLRAFRLGRYDVMLRFVPDRYRARMDVAKMKAQFEGPSKEPMDALIDALEASVDDAIVERGNEARMIYGERFEVKFVREEGLWKLKDLD